MAKPIQWEYLVLEKDELPQNGDCLIELNRLGEQGWELITTCHICEPPYAKIRMIFKREKK